ncbi:MULTISPECIES: hypothetical protein [Streptomyces]|uniref:Uncharacterized protein n=1 Tax=Streptomyces galilaeus TaxID=33899 RepID=A0ABW9ITQ3_STRGJ
MTWSYWAGAGGVSLPVLVLLFFAMRRAKGGTPTPPPTDASLA